jgi:hypothetical protein
MARKADKERAEALAQLREWLHPGDTVYTILDHVSASGMSRAIRVVIPCVVGRSVESTAPGSKPTDYVRRDSLTTEFLHPNYAVGKALGLRHWRRHGHEQDALVIGGCGMDMGFHLVYELSYALFGSGYQCLGKGGNCPSNYHTNHHDSVQCWTVTPDDETRCTYDGASKRVDVGEGASITCKCWGYDGIVCPRCEGSGLVPNPEGPERFDLMHTDGYALRHRWL